MGDLWHSLENYKFRLLFGNHKAGYYRVMHATAFSNCYGSTCLTARFV